MSATIGISTGLFKKIYKDSELGKMLSHSKSLPIDAIQILFARPNMLKHQFTDEEIGFLHSLKHVSIHAPFFTDEKGYIDIAFSKNNEWILDRIEGISEKIGSSCCVIHSDLIKDPDILIKRKTLFLFENLKKKRNVGSQQLKALFKTFPQIKLVLDVEHALDWSSGEVDQLISLFKERIEQIQLSDGDRGFKDFLQNGGNLERFIPLKKLNCPIIIESKPESLDALPAVINKVRAFFLVKDVK